MNGTGTPALKFVAPTRAGGEESRDVSPGPAKRRRVGEPATSAVAEASAASEAEPLQMQPQPPPVQSWFLLVKKGYMGTDEYGTRDFVEGHAQVVLPGQGYFGVSYGPSLASGQRGFTTSDPLRMHNPDIVISGDIRAGGIAAMLDMETALSDMSRRVPYDRTGEGTSMNCLKGAALILEAATGAKLMSAIHPGETLGNFALDVHDGLNASQVPFSWREGQGLAMAAKPWDNVPDKDFNRRGGGVRSSL